MEFWRKGGAGGREQGAGARPPSRFRLLLAPCYLLLISGALRAEPTFFTARIAPVLDKHCVVCHGPEKQKADLRLDSFENVMHGAKSGEVIKPGDLKGSELFRRITLPESDDEVMPSDGKPHLSAAEIKLIEFWIQRGASGEKVVADYPDAPRPPAPKRAAVALAPDWHAQAKAIAALQQELGLKLVPRSQVATDGLVLRTASAPHRCDNQALAKLAPIAALIVDAELARTAVTDDGLKALAACENLHAIDLTETKITSAGVAHLVTLKKLESLNLTQTAVDDEGVAKVKGLPALKHLWLFGTKVSSEPGEKVVAK